MTKPKTKNDRTMDSQDEAESKKRRLDGVYRAIGPKLGTKMYPKELFINKVLYEIKTIAWHELSRGVRGNAILLRACGK